MNTCPICLQPYQHISVTPRGTLYVHRLEKGKVTDYCTGKSKSREGKHIIITPEGEKKVALQSSSVVGLRQITYQCDQNILSPYVGRRLQKMPFSTFDFVALKEKYPSAFGRGAAAGKPSISISENGRISFSVKATEIFAGCTAVQPAFDQAVNKLAFSGAPKIPEGKANKFLEITQPKPGKDGKIKTKSITVNGGVLLKAIGYDFKKAGNQIFEFSKVDAEKKTVVVDLPKETPTAKPKQLRKKKEAKAPVAAAGAGTNGAVAPNVAPPPASNAGDDIVVDI